MISRFSLEAWISERFASLSDLAELYFGCIATLSFPPQAFIQTLSLVSSLSPKLCATLHPATMKE
jgi:hypothetical protein